METNTLVMFLIRWVHLLAGIIWLGTLYFLNFVNVHVAKTYDADTRKKIVPELMPRVMFFFRWSAMVTFVTGWAYIVWMLYVVSNAGMRGAGGLLSSDWGHWITLGAFFASTMWFNVWFVVWPLQKKIIAAIKVGQAPDAALVARSAKFSQINTYLSVPMLFFMGAASHLNFHVVYLGIALLGGFLIAHHLLGVSGKVKIEV